MLWGRFPVRVHTYAVGLIPVPGVYRKQPIDVCLSHQCFSLSLPHSLSKKLWKYVLGWRLWGEKESRLYCSTIRIVKSKQITKSPNEDMEKKYATGGRVSCKPQWISVIESTKSNTHLSYNTAIQFLRICWHNFFTEMYIIYIYTLEGTEVLSPWNCLFGILI